MARGLSERGPRGEKPVRVERDGASGSFRPPAGRFSERRASRASVLAPVWLLLLALLPVLGGCDIAGVDCTAEFVYGIVVRAYDFEAGGPITEGLAGHVLQSNYAETMVVWENSLMGAGERKGTYSVVVTAPGYQDWVRTGVVVRDEGCHVATVELKAYLVPE